MKDYRTTTSFFIGESMDGTPVFFDTHFGVFNQKPPVTVITGQPGSGKTFLGSLIVMNSAITGKQTVVLDPKGDFLPLANMKDDLNDIVVWNLSDNRKSGILDPFAMVESGGEKLALVNSVIDLFTGGLTREEESILQPLIKDVIESPNPSLQKVVMELKKTQGSDEPSQKARQLGSRLDSIAVMPFSRLCFSPGGGSRSLGGLSDNLTIITLLGLPLPKSEKDAKEPEGRLASGIIYLITYLVDKLMTSGKDKLPKTLFIDEAWQILSNSYGAKLIESIALLGRSLNMALILATQNNSHIKRIDIDSTVTSRFAFSTDSKEAENIVKDMNLPENEGFEDIFLQLDTGQCIMQDIDSRYAAINVIMWKNEWIEMLQTNPKERMLKEAAKKKEIAG